LCPGRLGIEGLGIEEVETTELDLYLGGLETIGGLDQYSLEMTQRTRLEMTQRTRLETPTAAIDCSISGQKICLERPRFEWDWKLVRRLAQKWGWHWALEFSCDHFWIFPSPRLQGPQQVGISSLK